MLVKLSKQCTHDVKKYLFTTYCSSIYGCPLWCSYKSADYKKASVAYNDVYRSLFNIRRGESISSIFVSNNIHSFNVLVRKYIFSFRKRLLLSSNNILKCIINSVFFTTSQMTYQWNQLLYVQSLFAILIYTSQIIDFIYLVFIPMYLCVSCCFSVYVNMCIMYLSTSCTYVILFTYVLQTTCLK